MSSTHSMLGGGKRESASQRAAQIVLERRFTMLPRENDGGGGMSQHHPRSGDALQGFLARHFTIQSWRDGPQALLGGKSSASHCAMQIVLGVAMAAGKLRTAQLENGLHRRDRDALRQQMPGDPEVHNAPVGRRKSLRNPPSLHAALVDRSGLIEGDRRCGMGVPRWNARLAGMRTIGREPKGPPSLHGGLDQGTCLRRHASPGMHDLHPGTIAAAATPAQLLVGKAGESAQMTVNGGEPGDHFRGTAGSHPPASSGGEWLR